MGGLKMENLSKFNAQGKRIASVILGIHYTTDEERQVYINDGYISISDEDYQHYIGNRGAGDNGTGYIRDIKTGKPVSDAERLDVYEAMAAQEERLAAQAERIAALEAALEVKGGDSK